MEVKKSTWAVLSIINCNEHTKKKSNLTYLSWTWAWGIVKENFPSANYRVVHYDGKPYLHDEHLGYLVSTEVTIDGETIPMNLPVMDGANKAMNHIEWKYKVKEYINGKFTGKYIDKSVERATMFDINTAIMRCLTKNISMFGLGHYIYTGEDVPYDPDEAKTQSDAKEAIKEKKTEPKTESKAESKTFMTLEIDDANWQKVIKYVQSNKHLGFDRVFATLQTKYAISEPATNKIKEEMK